MALTNKLTTIADAIREKTGDTALLTLDQMPVAILGITTGGSGGDSDITEEQLTFANNLSYWGYGGTWDWFFETYGDRIKTRDVMFLNSAFDCSSLARIPFVINVVDADNLNACFHLMYHLKECPKIRGTFKFSTSTNFVNFISSCENVRDFEDLLEPSALDGFASVKVTGSYMCPKAPKFQGCHSLRRVPTWFYKFKLSNESTAMPSNTYMLYPNCFESCKAIDEIKDIPVWCGDGINAVSTSNMFSSTFNYCCRIKSLTFETDNGQPIAVRWKSQTIDLGRDDIGCGTVGWTPTDSSGIPLDKGIEGFNSDPITAEHIAKYNEVKDSPDWWTTLMAFSRYNHDSAVETINSLPDTSAYLASAGGTNTIKFKGEAGSATDGGAINTLTAEEIAVATAKGWTVTLV